MKSNIILSSMMLLALLPVTGCDDWLEPKPMNDTDYNSSIKTDEYFASLREWKQSPGLPQVFVWFDNWTGTSPTGMNSLTGLPDSVTIASNWGSSGADTTKFNLSAAQKADMEYVQKVKGTKVVFTMFSRYIGEGLPYSKYPYYYDENKQYAHKTIMNNYYNYDKEEARKWIRRYAEDLYHACIETGYDGYDWDYEPGFGMGSGSNAPFWDSRYTELSCMFIEEMSYWFGRLAMDPSRDRGDRPMPERRLLFLIDGSVGVGGKMQDGWPLDCFDYYILQAYGASYLDPRVINAINDVSENYAFHDAVLEDPADIVGRIILTENFESFASNGGYFLNMSQYVYNGLYDGQPVDRQIGGCGAYRIGFDYDHGNLEYNGYPEYYWLRQGITNIYRIYRERQAQVSGSENN